MMSPRNINFPITNSNNKLCHLFEIFAVSVAKWKLYWNLLFFLMRTVLALVRDSSVTAIIIPSECGGIQRRLCTRYKYLWVSDYFQHTWVGGYARCLRSNWMSVLNWCEFVSLDAGCFTTSRSSLK